ncbi:MAG: DNA repair protein RecO [Syntrophorhabdaceae bacterium PtaU1.Bin034]|nr:MAG: DNA repair protein RecO [Syntrophorhabdaceae bacterium PtaU1.Bin034]
MALHKDEAIVLSARVFGESDKILRFFTLSSGKLSGIAKGGKKSQKRFMNTLELFNHINIEYFEKFGKGLVRIDNADLIEANNGIESSFKKMCVAAFFTEFVDRLTKEKERNEPLFRFLKSSLNRVKSVEFTCSDVLYYQLQMLDHLGYMPNFKTCVQCGKDLAEHEKVSFSNERGGTVCPVCSRSVPHRRYPEGVVTRLSDPEAVNAIDNHAFERHGREILEAFTSFHLNVEFKSYRLLRSVT